MRIHIIVENAAALRAAVAGLRSVDDAGDGLLEQLEARAATETQRARLAAAPSRSDIARAIKPRVDDVAVIAAMHQHAGNVSAAAKALGVSRSTVRERVARYTATLATARAANDR